MATHPKGCGYQKLAPIAKQYSMKTFKIIFYLCLTIISVFPATNARGEEAQLVSQNTVVVAEGKVTIRAQDADLAEILRELSQKAGFQLFLYRPLNKKIAVDITDLPVEEALKKLLPGYGFLSRKSAGKEHTLRSVAVLEGGGAKGTAYGKQTIARLNYGAGPGMIGRIDTPGTERQGPRSFAVDGTGSIYICDTINKRVAVFGPDGKVKRTLAEVGIPTDIAVTESGTVYILDEETGKILGFLPDGKRLPDMPVPSSLLTRTQSLETLGESLFLRTRDQEEYELISPGAKGSSDQGRVEGPFRGSRISPETSCLVRKVSSEEGEVQIVGQGGEVVDTIPLPVDRLASIVLLGRDEEMNLYLQVEQSRPDTPGVALGVIKLNPGWIILDKIENIPADYSNWTARLLQVDGKGDIVQMLPGPDAVELNRWSQKRGEQVEGGHR